MIELSTSQMHVANVLDRSYAADPHQILGRWPRLLIVTEDASLQLDPGIGLTRAQAMPTSGRLLGEVARRDASIRSCDGVQQAMRIELVDDKDGPEMTQNRMVGPLATGPLEPSPHRRNRHIRWPASRATFSLLRAWNRWLPR